MLLINEGLDVINGRLVGNPCRGQLCETVLADDRRRARGEPGAAVPALMRSAPKKAATESAGLCNKTAGWLRTTLSYAASHAR